MSKSGTRINPNKMKFKNVYALKKNQFKGKKEILQEYIDFYIWQCYFKKWFYQINIMFCLLMFITCKYVYFGFLLRRIYE